MAPGFETPDVAATTKADDAYWAASQRPRRIDEVGADSESHPASTGQQ